MTQSSDTNLKALDILRGLSALAVYFGHFAQQFGKNGPGFVLLGEIGVSIFFVLSGFLIHFGAIRSREENERVKWQSYARRRFFRIFPAYAFALVCYSAIGTYVHTDLISAATASGFISHLLLFSTFVPHERISINVVFWTVVIECHFYAMYPFLVRVTQQVRPLATFACTWLGGISIFLAIYVLTKPGEPRVMLQNSSPVLFWHWTLGMLLAEAVSRWEAPILKRWLSKGWLLAPVLLALYGGTIWNSHAIELNYKRFILPFVCFALVGLFVFSPLQQLRSRLGEWLGATSYSLYLWHPLAIAAVSVLALPSMALNLLLSLSLSIGLAAASYYAIERPMIKLGHRAAQ